MSFDPYQALLKKKETNTAPTDVLSVQSYPEEDIKALEDYCKKMNIVGFDTGRLPPSVALALLKSRLGDNYTNIPLEERVPYSQTMQKKQLIFG